MNASESAPRIPVLFVGGMGRSGSTIIERLIGQIEGMCNLGEVVFLADRGVRHNQTCGCGELFSECPFWTKVGDIAFDGWSNVDVEHRDELYSQVDDVKYTPRMLLPRWTPTFDAHRAEYTEFFRRLYAAAAEVSGASVIVDSSKQTSLVYALSHDAGLDLRLLHLVRDPRGVAFSWTRKVRRPEITDREEFMPTYRPSYMAALWSGHNVLLTALRLRRVPTLRLNYEQFTADPRSALAAVANIRPALRRRVCRSSAPTEPPSRWPRPTRSPATRCGSRPVRSRSAAIPAGAKACPAEPRTWCR